MNQPISATNPASQDCQTATCDTEGVPYDSLLLVSFGGPECRDDVIPFLENVLRGKNVPRERMLAVAEHYYHFDGVSPINEQCRQLIRALRVELDKNGIKLPIYWGNRNWNPLLPQTMQEMASKGHRKTLAVMTSAYSSYSGCRQYRENVEAAQTVVGVDAPHVDKLRVFYNHPLFISSSRDRLAAALRQISTDRLAGVQIAYTAHSIPMSMANTSQYVQQLTETCRLVSESLGIASDKWALVYQSRSGRPEDPWLEPDIGDHLRALKASGTKDVVIMPIGFLSDHMEVLFDLDHEAHDICHEIGLNMVRAGTVGIHPDFVRMLRELIQERMSSGCEKVAVGQYPANHDRCPANCCPAPVMRRPVAPSVAPTADK